MDLRLTRRRLISTSLAGVPLLAACRGGGHEPAPPSAALPPLGGTPSPEAEAGSLEAAVPEATARPPSPQPEPTPAPASHVRTVVLDPGHGGEEIGAASAIRGLPNLLEKDSNLAFTFRLRELLEADGYRVVLTRESDSRAIGFVPPGPNTTPGPDGSPASLITARSDLQARVDLANENHGDLYLSLHSNDSGDLSENGVEVWYCLDREDGPANQVFAQILLDSVLGGLRDYGYRANNRGTKEDHYFRVRNGQNFHIFVLGPPNPGARHTRATMMPAALVENLFMRHERDQWVLRDPDAREAITQAMRRAVGQFFEWHG